MSRAMHGVLRACTLAWLLAVAAGGVRGPLGWAFIWAAVITGTYETTTTIRRQNRGRQGTHHQADPAGARAGTCQRASDGACACRARASGAGTRIILTIDEAAVIHAGVITAARITRGGITTTIRDPHHVTDPGLPPSSPGQPEDARLPVEYEAMGTVTGYRWWTLGAPDLDSSPALADESWDPDLRDRLRGMAGVWQPGLNTAICKPRTGVIEPAYHPAATVPDPSCYCGFWGYWKPMLPHDISAPGRLPVYGVIRGSGDVEICERMFRASQARIVALHCPFTLGGEDPLARALSGRKPGSEGRRHGPWYNHPLFTGTVINIGASPPVPLAPRECEHGIPVTMACEPCDEQREAAQAEARVRADAWMAVIGDRLEQMYPGARYYQTVDLMLKDFPPDPQYGNLPDT